MCLFILTFTCSLVFYLCALSCWTLVTRSDHNTTRWDYPVPTKLSASDIRLLPTYLCDKWLPLLLSSDCFCSYLLCNTRNIAKPGISKANLMLAECNHSYFILRRWNLSWVLEQLSTRDNLLVWVGSQQLLTDLRRYSHRNCNSYITSNFLGDLLVMNVNLKSIQFIKRCILIKVTSFLHQIISVAKGIFKRDANGTSSFM